MGWTGALESLEEERESIAAQCAYALALDRGEHPEVIEQARRETAEDARWVAEGLATKGNG